MDRKKSAKVGLAGLESNFNETIQENEYRVNRLSGWLALLAPIAAVIVLVLNKTGIFILDNDEISLVMLLIIPFFLMSFVMGAVLKIEKPWVKFFLMINECISVMIIYGFMSMHAVLILVLPIMKSCLYFDLKHTKITFFCSSVAIFFAHVMSVSLSIVPTDTLAENMFSALVYAFVPRYIEYIVLCAAALYIAKNSSKLIHRTYQFAENNEKLMQDMRSSRYEIVRSLGTVADNKSKDTGEHIGRVFEYMKILAEGFGYNGDEVNEIALAAMLHDIGKLAVDEKILSKPGKLTNEEFAEMKKHAELGRDLLANSNDSVMKKASVIALQHHERWDGYGYYGMQGEEIDLLSRMMSVVDVFDALTSKRCYKDSWSIKDAYKDIVEGSGTQFDPEVVEVFVRNFDRIREVCYKMNPDCKR